MNRRPKLPLRPNAQVVRSESDGLRPRRSHHANPAITETDHQNKRRPQSVKPTENGRRRRVVAALRGSGVIVTSGPYWT